MPDLWMDVDAALSGVPVNVMPLMDDTDHKTRETSITYDQAGMDLVWNFATTAGAMSQTAVTPTTGGDYDWANQGDGMYSIEIPASGGASINNDTEGFGWFTGYCTGVLPWRGPVIGFRAAALNNALIDGGDELDVNVTKVSDTAQTANDNGADINAILVDTNELQADDIPGTLATMDGKLDTIDNFLDTEIAAILEDTGTTLPATLTTIEGKVDTIDGIVDDILLDTAEIGVAGAGLTDVSIADAAISSATFDTAALDAAALAADAANEIADALLDRTNGIETSYTPRQALRLILAALVAKLDGAGTTTVTIRDINDSKDRITATVDADGNRSAVTPDAT